MVAESLQGSQEVELKLEFDPAEAAHLKSHPIFAGRGRQQQALISIYYDTPDLVLRRAGVYLRVRDRDGSFLQTIKAASDAEPMQRYEWERELPRREPDLAAAKGSPLGLLLTDEVRASLRPAFETRIMRTAYLIEHDGSEIEAAVDEGEIAAGARRCAVCELELELKGGEAASLFRLARALGDIAQLRLAVKSKAERGYELVTGEARPFEKAVDIQVPPEMPSGEAFRAIAWSCLRQIVGNEPGTCMGHAEALHQMRIGLRRLRAALALFAGIAAGKDQDRIASELKWITRELGPARDLDVFATDILQPLKSARPEDESVAAAHDEFEEKRAAAYARARGSVRSDRFRGALLDLAAWIETGERKTAAADRPIAEHAAAELARLRKQIKKRGAKLRDLGISKRHKLRIRAKRLRYATEFFAGTFAGEKAAKRQAESLSALKDMQDALGALNDLATHRALAAGDVDREGVAADHARHHSGGASGDEETLLADAEKAYARFAKVKPFWKA